MKPLGSKGEDIAADYLKEKGFKVLQRNYRTPIGEADIIVRDRDTLVFVEVKARTTDTYGQPFEAVDHRKQEKLRRIALYYVTRNKLEMPVRFDVISIISRSGKDEINHIVEAF
ncbi:MAG: YraN family protein [Nitrospirae bacterium]|nr:YraN family protein [Nitrospirota bacterium]MCL5237101.1 YraN family protein [Nitrospirota bacterium]